MSERLLTNMSAFDGLSLEQKKEAVTFAAYVTGYPVWVSSEAYDCNGRPLASCFSVHTDWPARDIATAPDLLAERDALIAERDRLREALANLVTAYTQLDDAFGNEPKGAALTAARAALEPKP